MHDIGHSTEIIASLGRNGAAEKLTRKLQSKHRSSQDLQDAVRQFESILLVRLFEEMKRTIPEGGLLDDPMCKQMNDLFWYYLADDLAAKGGLGISDELYREMSHLTAGPAGQPITEQLL